LASVATSGCNIAAPIFLAVHGPGSIPKAYELDGERRTVILVDDPANRVAQRRYRALIGESAQNLLLKKKVIDDGKAIDTRAALAMAARPAEGGPMSIRAVGESVGADVVIYGIISEFNPAPPSDAAAPASLMHVKIIDVATGDRLWPAQAEGYPLRLTMPAAPSTLANGGMTDRVRVEEALAAFTGVGLAQMFYDVELPESVRRP
jgi:hypothetical protein